MSTNLMDEFFATHSYNEEPDWKAKPELAHEPDDELQMNAILKEAHDKKPLYVRRDVINGNDIVAWAKSVGFDTTLPAEDLHVTIAYSKTPVLWSAAGDASPSFEIKSGARQVVLIGENKDVAVLKFSSYLLTERWKAFMSIGASWDWASFQPHITISLAVPAGLDVKKITPFAGTIELGPEIFEPVKEDWKASVVEKEEVAPYKLSFLQVIKKHLFG